MASTTITAQRLNNQLIGLAKRRNTNIVTVDDAHRVLDRFGVGAQERRSFISTVFNRNSETFVPVGTTTSERGTGTITQWSLV